MELNRNVFTPAHIFAIGQEGLTTNEVIAMIKEGTLGGRLFDDQWFVDTTAAQTQEYLRDPQEYLRRVGSRQPAETTTSQTQAQQRESEHNGASEGVSYLPIVFVLRMFSIVAIAFGVIVGLYLLFESYQFTTFLFVTSEAELTFGEVTMAFSVTLFFCIHGAFCLAFAKIIESLHK